MRIVKFIAVMIALMFFVGTSCIRPFFFQLEYELSSCPSKESEWPRPFHRLESTLEVVNQELECKGFSKYLYTKYKRDGGAIGSDWAYVKLLPGNPCIVRMVTSAPCSTRDCSEEAGQLADLSTRAIDQSKELGAILWSKQNISVTSAAPKVTKIGPYDSFENWCNAQTESPQSARVQ